MGAFLTGAELLKAAFPGAGIILVHHLGKDSSRGARGHSSFGANVGTQLNVDCDQQSKVRTVRVGKQRDGRTDLTFNFELAVIEVGMDDDGEAITSCVVKDCARRDRRLRPQTSKYMNGYGVGTCGRTRVDRYRGKKFGETLVA